MKLFIVSFYERLFDSKYDIYSAEELNYLSSLEKNIKEKIKDSIDNFLSSVHHNDDVPYFGIRIVECDDDMTAERLVSGGLKDHEQLLSDLQEQIRTDKYNLHKYDINGDEEELIVYNKLLEVMADYWYTMAGDYEL